MVFGDEFTRWAIKYAARLGKVMRVKEFDYIYKGSLKLFGVSAGYRSRKLNKWCHEILIFNLNGLY